MSEVAVIGRFRVCGFCGVVVAFGEVWVEKAESDQGDRRCFLSRISCLSGGFKNDGKSNAGERQ